MLWELEPRVLDKCAMPLQAYRLRPTGLGLLGLLLGLLGLLLGLLVMHTSC